MVLGKIKPETPPAESAEQSSSTTTVPTPLTIQSLKRQADYLYEDAPRDDPEFVKALERFIRGSLIQGTELLQTIKDLKRAKLAETLRVISLCKQVVYLQQLETRQDRRAFKIHVLYSNISNSAGRYSCTC